MPPRSSKSKGASKSARARLDKIEPLCPIDHPLLFQVILPRVKDLMHDGSDDEDRMVPDSVYRMAPEDEGDFREEDEGGSDFFKNVLQTFADVSPLALLTAMAATDMYIDRYDFKTQDKFMWMMDETKERPEPYIKRLAHLLPEIHTLSFSDGLLLEKLSLFPNIRSIHWDGDCRLDGTIIASWHEGIPTLRHLDLKLKQHPVDVGVPSAQLGTHYSNMIKGVVKLHRLEKLHLMLGLPKTTLPPLGALSQLRELVLSGIREEVKTKVSVAHLQGLSQLTKFVLHGHLEPDARKTLGSLLPKLTILSLDTDKDEYTSAALQNWLEHFGKSLQYLHLVGAVDAAGVEHLAQMTNLVKLQLAMRRHVHMPPLGALTKLKWLRIEYYPSKWGVYGADMVDYEVPEPTGNLIKDLKDETNATVSSETPRGLHLLRTLFVIEAATMSEQAVLQLNTLLPSLNYFSSTKHALTERGEDFLKNSKRRMGFFSSIDKY